MALYERYIYSVFVLSCVTDCFTVCHHCICQWLNKNTVRLLLNLWSQFNWSHYKQ